MWHEIRPFAQSPQRRAVVAVQVVMMSTVIVGFAALAIDVGYMYALNNEMQNAVDAGALAGASGLPIDNDVVRARAIEFAGKNRLANEAVSVTDKDVRIGNWEWTSQTFTPATVAGVSPNAVRVVGQKDRLPLFFAAILGVRETDVFRDAVALVDSGRCLGVWGLEGIDCDGGVITDSYDSRDGSYGPGNINPNGDICSNMGIQINGDVSIRGDAMAAPGYEVDIRGSSYEVWGVVGSTCCQVDAPVVDASEAQYTNDNDSAGTNMDRLTDRGYYQPDNNDKLTLTSTDNLTLWGGTYYFTSVKMAAQATLTVAGPTVIYIDGNAMFSAGGLVNVAEDPKDLIIYCTGKSIMMNGGAAVYATLVAPNTNVTLVGTAEIYGTIIARTIDVRGDFGFTLMKPSSPISLAVPGR